MTLHNRREAALFVYKSPAHGILHDAVARSHHALIGQVMYQLPKNVDRLAQIMAACRALASSFFCAPAFRLGYTPVIQGIPTGPGPSCSVVPFQVDPELDYWPDGAADIFDIRMEYQQRPGS